MTNYLEYAISLAEMVDGQTGQNPPVGAVVVKDGNIVGIGSHLKQGEAHAEVQAIHMASERCKGATIYVSLEPCSHYGSTPPCALKIIEAGITKVVYATKDVSLEKTGHDVLEDHGIDVTYRPSDRAHRLYDSFFKSKSQQKPIVTVKVSCSLDGKQANDHGESKWITNKKVKQDVFRLRHEHDAILTGHQTVLADDPTLTTRIEEGKNPKRFILSRKSDIQFDQQIYQDPTHPVTIITENENLKSPYEHIEIIYLPKCEVEQILNVLFERGIGRVLVEAGPNVSSQFLTSSFTNQFILYYAPKLIGGTGQYQFYQTDNVNPLDQTPQFQIMNTQMLDDNVKLTLKRK
ncbi:bifunctional diaminohydroxyphosphoribosylaminopyrimidine deaminase/5-amino-6-(5-phosphoribosylamino)uracil reductase RibD [Staphylococcus massiliensis]|uniref:bifunctional diaminohydroxyphosphoribosylaminopyrimidine deaminase/5-amino-6-(5-phosphoribosylamino)uracil reductase RibD n=1 Tax=Staphylococcus massiliensis TaxID=555791 RepID=UPI001EDE9259|nr:bifunctional diaminohydroxyphosphoribosylaminopyrimidine deaminase/5-amino-6-(5-phosphoribosylamino)uracil reductase RibD [Staphylococcus massiliensis]MCG3412040.1 bifunctional diaminohydroxyphosphoribosylaminopyrimidine deaminase/5-amino-6-(5-phosphoribosylamino)uracil reductase RibD [Staphylococcus massiliensis]